MANIGRVGEKVGAWIQTAEQLLLLGVTNEPRATTAGRIADAARARRSHARARNDRARGLVILLGGRATPKLGYRVLNGDHELLER